MECAAIALVVIGVVLATVTDSTVMTNMLGCLLSGAAIVFSAVYQVEVFTLYSSWCVTADVASLRLPGQCSLITLCMASFQSYGIPLFAIPATKESVAFPFSISLQSSALKPCVCRCGSAPSRRSWRQAACSSCTSTRPGRPGCWRC